MLFKNVVGHSNIKTKLLESVKKNRISHAQLFLGPEGSGNLAMALAYAQYVQCENPGETDSCGECRSCKQHEKFIHPDVHFAFPVNTSSEIKKDPNSEKYLPKWRSALIANAYINQNQWYGHIGIETKQGLINKADSAEIIKKLNLKSFESEYKVLIIWMPELMNQTSANMLLKLIEEPPSKTLILMVSENTDKILITIISRTQLVKIPGISVEDMENALVEKNQLSTEEAKRVAQMANGNYNRALIEINERGSNDFNLANFQTMMRHCFTGEVPKVFQWIDEIALIGRERLKNFLSYGINIVRENLMLNLGQDDLVFLALEELEWSKKFSPYIHVDNVNRIINELDSAHTHISQNANAKIVLTDMTLKLMKLIRS